MNGTHTPRHGSLTALALVVCAGCAVGPDYARPELAAPDRWNAADAAFPAAPPDLTGWWRKLGAPQLDELVASALTANLDLRAATARIREARAAAGIADAGRLPQLDGTAGYTRQRTTEATPSPVRGREFDTWTLGFDASWEIDLFGRIAREREAAGADVDAARADADVVRVTLVAEVVAAYAELDGATRRRAVAAASVAAAADLVALTRARTESGVGNDLDTARAERLLAAAQARLPAQDRDRTRAAHRLAVLVGRAPGELVASLDDATPLAPVPDVVAIGLPAELVRHRPDVVAAERDLHAATARLGVALAERFPRITLGGFFGLESDRAGDLLRSSSRAFRGGPTVRLPLYTGGGVGARIAVQEARIEAAAVELEHRVLRAFEEVENAVDGLQHERRRFADLGVAVAAAERSRGFAQQRFDAGLDDFLAVLEAEQSRLDLADQLAQSSTELVRLYVALHKALGGAPLGVTPTAAAG